MIGDLIRWEGIALLSSVFWGMVYAGIYDCIRIIRRVFKHRYVWLLIIEDIIFWLYVGINVFCITFQLNDGVIRGFSIAGYILGAVIYRYTIGWILVKYITKIILFILKPLKKLFRFIRIKTKKLIAAGKVKRTAKKQRKRNNAKQSNVKQSSEKQNSK